MQVDLQNLCVFSSCLSPKQLPFVCDGSWRGEDPSSEDNVAKKESSPLPLPGKHICQDCKKTSTFVSPVKWKAAAAQNLICSPPSSPGAR